jgi:hypothetical protein
VLLHLRAWIAFAFDPPGSLSDFLRFPAFSASFVTMGLRKIAVSFHYGLSVIWQLSVVLTHTLLFRFQNPVHLSYLLPLITKSKLMGSKQ